MNKTALSLAITSLLMTSIVFAEDITYEREDAKKLVKEQGVDKKKTADQVAKELANPNTALASMNFKFQYTSMTGDLAGADNQDKFTTIFQPSMPFPLDNGDKVLFRPAFSYTSDQPTPSAAGWQQDSGFGDIVFDLAYAPKVAPDTIVAFGLVSSLPVGAEGFSSEKLTIGPEILFGKLAKTHILGLFPNHQWSVAGGGDKDISITSLQVFAVYMPGGGWTIGSSPTMTYDWKAEQALVPLNLNVSKTLVLGSRPWKLGMEVNYYVEKSDDFGPDFMLGFNVTPVVENKLANLF